MRKQNPHLRVHLIVCSNGERLPTLLRPNGIPDFAATLWVTTKLRPQNLASATIELALRSLIVLDLVLQGRKINLTQRLLAGQLLEFSDVEAIVKAAKYSIRTLEEEFKKTHIGTLKNPKKTNNIENFRNRNTYKSSADPVQSSTTSIRLHFIRQFISWRANREIFRMSGKKRNDLILLRDAIDSEFKNKSTEIRGKNRISDRLGLTTEQCKLVLSTTNPDSPKNPWNNNFNKIRNQLLVRFLLDLGIRRSELLGLKISDISALSQELRILRRPDDVSDPRSHEPNTKTRARILTIEKDLFDLYRSYLSLRNTRTKGRHGFVFVSVTGAPLSKSESNRIFKDLRDVTKISPLSPHILRHTHFDELAEELKKTNLTDEQQVRIMRQQGGWSDQSDSHLKYIRRFINKEVRDASISAQKKIRIKYKNGPEE